MCIRDRYARQTGARLEHIPYKGSGAMRNDLLGGQIRVAVDALPDVYKRQTSTSTPNWATRKRAPPRWWPTTCARSAWK